MTSPRRPGILLRRPRIEALLPSPRWICSSDWLIRFSSSISWGVIWKTVSSKPSKNSLFPLFPPKSFLASWPRSLKRVERSSWLPAAFSKALRENLSLKASLSTFLNPSSVLFNWSISVSFFCEIYYNETISFSFLLITVFNFPRTYILSSFNFYDSVNSVIFNVLS